MKKIWVASAIGIIIALIGSIIPASANASYGPYDINNNGNGFYLHAHSDNGPLTNSSATPPQDWAIVTDTQGGSGQYQIVLQGTHWCASWHSTDNIIWLNPCDGTQISQEFTFTGTGNAGQVWYFSTACANANGGNGGFVTAFGTGDGATIDCEGPGQGNRAVWNNIDS